ncbi:hypothetical protein RFI_07082 [Reticulomyxa filosa]|uniref:Uncharacterized protein n=1 Tax=Reticulomyxa filosa TaxID=46433 RepID=X6NXN6_RETFI|nr:hypothetical protein RFI_07082 [Reticulomyxa filosa]|eukprot:ETO30037.1 hypothetical protein RFI_07082 [Reticulomyxa filosa]
MKSKIINQNISIVEESRKKLRKDKSMKKATEQIENEMRRLTRDLYLMQMPSHFALALVFVSTYAFLSTVYEAYVVAKLPFEPFSLLQKLSHRSLPGNDVTDCSMTFMLVIGSMAIRSNVQRYLVINRHVIKNNKKTCFSLFDRICPEDGHKPLDA